MTTPSHPTKTETTMKKDEICLRCKKPYPVKGIRVCSCHPMFDKNYKWEGGYIELKDENEVQKLQALLMEIEAKHKNEMTALRQSLVKEVEGKQRDMLSGIKRTADKMLREKNITHEAWERLIEVIGYYKKLSILQEKE